MEKENKEILSKITIQKLKEYGVEDYVLKTVNRLKCKGCHTLSALLEFDVNQEKGEMAKRIASWKSFVAQNAPQIISDWEEMYDLEAVKKIPSSYDPMSEFIVNLKKAIVEYAQIMQKRFSNERYARKKRIYAQSHKNELLCAQILLLAYQDGLDDDAISDSLQRDYYQKYTPYTIKQNKIKCFKKIFKGYTISDNIEVNSDFLAVAKSLEDECLFRSVNVYENYSGDTKHKFLEDFGFTLLKIKDDCIVVPSSTILVYKKVYKKAREILKDIIFPEDKEVLIDRIEESDDLKGIDYDPSFITNLLDNKSFVDVLEDGLVQIKTKYLTTAQERYVRIIYNAKENITAQDARKQYEKEYGKEPSAGPKGDERYKICTDGTSWYYGEPRVPVSRAIGDYVEENVIFSYADIEQYIKDLRYSFNPDTVRTYITNLCCVDNADPDHFCHKDFIDDYPSFSWRNSPKYGLANWVLKTTKSILGEDTSIGLNKLVSELVKQSRGTEYEEGTKKQAKIIIYKYSGEGNPFMCAKTILSKNKEKDMVEEEIILKNEPCFSETDFNTIGLRGEKYAFFSQIRDIAYNEVMRTDNHKVYLSELIKIINNNITEPQTRKVIIRAIEDKRHLFESNDIQLIDEEGKKIVVWTGTEIKSEPAYEISVSERDEETPLIRERIDVVSRPEIRYSQNIDWDALNQILKTELSFYGRWMSLEGFDLNVSIDNLLIILTHAQEENLSKEIPRCLYEYWFADTSIYDRKAYVNNLLLGFEALLEEIFYQTHGFRPQEKGLMKRAVLFDGLDEKLRYKKDSRGFDKIASNLYYYRNRVAHGESLKLTSMEIASTIINILALYVYVIARYYK